MPIKIGEVEYTPGYYGRKRPHPVELTDRCIRNWSEWQGRKRKRLPPGVCLSRKLGSGTLEVADMLAKRLGYLVADRQLLEVMANTQPYPEKIPALFERRYPGMLREHLSRIFDRGVFMRNDLTERLFSVVISVAGLGQTIFVGRGTHLLLPRDRTLAVWFISSTGVRAGRLARLFHVDEETAEAAISRIDREQSLFFEKTYQEPEASPYEFDLVINRDRVRRPEWAANIVEQAFKDKFGSERGK